MKFILALALTLCLFACKEQEPAVSTGTSSIVGKYEGSSTTPSFLFKYTFSDYKIFQETSTATIKEIGVGNYEMEFKLVGLAQKNPTSSPSNYQFETTVKLKVEKNAPNNLLSATGVYQSITPKHPNIGNTEQRVNGTLTYDTNTLKGELGVIYGEIGQPRDYSSIANFNLKKVK